MFFLHLGKHSFWTHQFWCLVGLLLIFVLPLPHQQNISLWRLFFIWGNKKKLLGMRSGEWQGWVQGSCHFWSKTAEHSAQNGQLHLYITLHKMDKFIERVFKKNSLKLKAASHTNASWSTDTEGILEHSRRGGNLYYKGAGLQKIILGFLGVPSHTRISQWMHK